MGARHPGRSGHYQAGLHNAGPSAPADGRSHRGTGHCEKQWARVSSYGDAAELLQVGRQRRDIGPGKGELPGAALPRVLPVTTPGKVSRPAPRSGPLSGREELRQGANAMTGSHPFNHIHALNSPGTNEKTAPGEVSVFYLVLRSQPTAMFHRSPVARAPVYPEISREQKGLPPWKTSAGAGKRCRVLAIFLSLTKCFVNQEV